MNPQAMQVPVEAVEAVVSRADVPETALAPSRRHYPRLAEAINLTSTLAAALMCVPLMPSLLAMLAIIWAQERVEAWVKRLRPEDSPSDEQSEQWAQEWLDAHRAERSVCPEAAAAADRGEYARADELLRAAIEADEHNAALHNQLGLMLSECLGWHDNAVVQLRIALSLDPGNVTYLKNFHEIASKHFDDERRGYAELPEPEDVAYN